MIDPILLRRLLYGGLFVLIGLSVAFVRLLPVNATSSALISPDLMLALALAWVVRRPEYLPIPLIAAVMLMGDVLFMRPPGLWAALCVAGVEVLRSRTVNIDRMTFGGEWALVSVIYLVMLLAEWAIMGIIVEVSQPFHVLVLRFLATMIIYPLVVLVSTYGLGVTRPVPGGLSAEGRAT